MSGLLGAEALARLQASLLPSGARERPLEELSTEELEARVLLGAERLQLVERGAFWGTAAATFVGTGKVFG